MQDEPHPTEILAAVAAFLRTTAIPEMTAHTGFQARVAANALDLVTRQITLAPASDEAEMTRLTGLLGQQGSLAELNGILADQIAAGDLTLDSAGMLGHLRATTLAKLAVDQPTYSGYRAALDAAKPKDG